MTQNNTEYYEVFTTHEYIKNEESKTAWLRIGAAFKNKDNSFNIVLRALPLPDVRTGMARLHMRLPKVSPEAETAQKSTGDNDVIYIYDIPLEEL